MKNLKYTFSFLFAGVLLFSCTREAEDLVPARFPTTAEIFTDNPVGLTDQFFVSFDPATGANTDAFGTDENEFFEGTSSIRIDVPSDSDPNGTYVGGIFEDRGSGRDLTDYNALTFYAKATTTATLGTVGFGNDFDQNNFVATLTDVPLSTGWTKYIVPFPDPSKLVQERGMFIFSAGSQSTGGQGYTIWFDEIKFENLSSVAQPLPQIFNGEDAEASSFNLLSLPVENASVVYNVAGLEVSVDAAPAYFNFTSSAPDVASVSDLGVITVNSAGTATITAAIGDAQARGSLEVTSDGDFDFAPDPPTRDPDDVISIFSDVYQSEPAFAAAVFNNPGIQIEQIDIQEESVLEYRNANFVGLGWAAPVDVSDFDFIHLDVYVTQEIGSGDGLAVEIIDFGADGVDDGGLNAGPDDTAGGFLIAGANLAEGQWVSVDIPVDGFTLATGGGGAGSPNLENVARIVLVGAAGIPNFYIDNIYFYKN